MTRRHRRRRTPVHRRRAILLLLVVGVAAVAAAAVLGWRLPVWTESQTAGAPARGTAGGGDDFTADERRQLERILQERGAGSRP